MEDDFGDNSAEWNLENQTTRVVINASVSFQVCFALSFKEPDTEDVYLYPRRHQGKPKQLLLKGQVDFVDSSPESGGLLLFVFLRRAYVTILICHKLSPTM